MFGVWVVLGKTQFNEYSHNQELHCAFAQKKTAEGE